MNKAATKNRSANRQSGALKGQLWSLLKSMAVISLLVVVVAGGTWGVLSVYGHLDKPVALIAVEGEFKYATRESVASLVEAELKGGFLSLNLQAIRQRLERDPWIESASVGRRWPDTLEINVVEETPIARWNRHSFLNRRGEVLDVQDNSGLTQLPLLLGPKGQAREVMEQYRHAAELLLPAGLKPMEFRLDERDAWHLKLAGELDVKVGQGQVTEKLKRFLTVYDAVLRERIDELKSVDVRYPNGIAVSWRSPGINPENQG